MLTRMVSNTLFPTPQPQRADCPHCKQALQIDKGVEEPITWTVGQRHPLVPDMMIVRMFVDRGGVEVYSHDGKNGMRNLIPMSFVRLIEEVMPLDLFAEELSAAEAESDDDGDEGDDEPEEAPVALPQVNGQVSP